MRWWLVVCLVAGCNQIYGLDPTIAGGPDEDGDGVPDVADNCLAVPNADQADEDDDDRGDACDRCNACAPCETARDHDEDGDRIDDGCDNCPARPNASQDNADGDHLGDACDRLPSFERRLLFDGFGTLVDAWLESGSPWTIIDDAVTPTMAAGPDTTRTLEHGTLGVASGTRWSIEVGLAPLPTDRQLAVFVNNSAWCLLEHQADGTWSLTAATPPAKVFSATFGAEMVLRLTPTGPLGAQYIACEIPEVASVADDVLELQYPAVPKLVTTALEARFRYIDVVGE